MTSAPWAAIRRRTSAGLPTAARISEINLSLYRAFMQPMVKAIFTPQVADMMKRLDTGKLQYEAFADTNPLMPQLAKAAKQVRENRKPVASDNPFIAAQEAVSEQIVKSLDAWRETTEKFSESMFLAIYGSPVLQAAVGVNTEATRPRRPGKSLMHRELMEKRIAELKSQIDKGGLAECCIRGLLYAGAPRGGVDERAVEALRRIRHDRCRIPTYTGAVQGDGARAVLHAAVGSGSHACGDSEVAAGRRCRT